MKNQVRTPIAEDRPLASRQAGLASFGLESGPSGRGPGAVHVEAPLVLEVSPLTALTSNGLRARAGRVGSGAAIVRFTEGLISGSANVRDAQHEH